ncbi:MAG: tetratricopeptide repeat protein [Bacteroidota bacterium]|nr:tetratricopeptide repeat protein [Bacteroidota bacterium]
MKHFLIILSILITVASANGQEYFKIDSLIKEVQNTKAKDKAKTYNIISWELRNTNPQEASKYGKLAIEFSKKYKNYSELAKAYSYTGVAYRNAGNFEQALEHYKLGLNVAQEHKLTEQQGYANINFANWYIYSGENDEALKHLSKAEKIGTQLNNKEMLAYCKLNIGRVYIELEQPEKANEYLKKALQIRKETKNKFGLSVCLKYIGDSYLLKKDQDKALENYNLAYESADRKFDKDLLADILQERAAIYLSDGQPDRAEKEAKLGLNEALQTQSPIRIRESYELLSDIYKTLNKLPEALKYNELAKTYTDSFYISQLADKITNIEFKKKQETSETKITDLQKDNNLINSRFKSERNKSWVLLVIIFLSLILVISFYVNYIQKKSAHRTEKEKNKLISEQNEELSQQNEEISAQRDKIMLQKSAIEKHQNQIKNSIIYAERIQNAAFPKMKYINSLIPYNFILFMPRDVVSGDFYYFNRNGKYLIASAVDCTGHGVPGAFVSMLGISLLNEITENKKISEPNIILEKLRTNIKYSLQQSSDSNSQNDGMDMALSVINTETLELEFAGANNPVYIIRNHELTELAGTFNPVGNYFREKPFKKEVYQLRKDDTLYMFSDGYADQFGGEYDRKFLSSRLKETLLSIQKYPMSIQKNLLKKKFEEWKGQQKQIDDVLIIGIKIRELLNDIQK